MRAFLRQLFSRTFSLSVRYFASDAIASAKREKDWSSWMAEKSVAIDVAFCGSIEFLPYRLRTWPATLNFVTSFGTAMSDLVSPRHCLVYLLPSCLNIPPVTPMLIPRNTQYMQKSSGVACASTSRKSVATSSRSK